MWNSTGNALFYLEHIIRQRIVIEAPFITTVKEDSKMRV